MEVKLEFEAALRQLGPGCEGIVVPVWVRKLLKSHKGDRIKLSVEGIEKLNTSTPELLDDSPVAGWLENFFYAPMLVGVSEALQFSHYDQEVFSE